MTTVGFSLNDTGADWIGKQSGVCNKEFMLITSTTAVRVIEFGDDSALQDNKNKLVNK